VPLVVFVLPLSSDELLGERWLISLFDDLHTFLELVVVALVCQFAKLQHTACLQVACSVTAEWKDEHNKWHIIPLSVTDVEQRETKQEANEDNDNQGTQGGTV
jgi:hypothetical protein